MEILADRLWFSTWQAVVTVVLALLLGGGLALCEHYFRVRAVGWFTAVMTLPIFLPSAAVALGFIAVWGNAGYVNDLLGLFGIEHIQFLYSPVAIIASHLFYNIPLAYVIIRLRLGTMHSDLEEAAYSTGASPWHAFRSITLPRIRTALIGSGLLVFMYSFMSFALPLILGGIRYQTLEVYIFALATQQLAFDSALVVAALQFVLLVGLVWLGWRYQKSINETRLETSVEPRSRKSLLIIWMARLTLLAYIVGPLLAVLFKGLYIDAIQQLLSTDFITAWLRTFGIATVAVIASLMMSIWFVVSLRKSLSRYAFALIAISPVTLGLVIRITLGQSLFGLLLAYMFMLLPFILYIVHTRWQTRPSWFLETHKLLGAAPLQLLACLGDGDG